MSFGAAGRNAYATDENAAARRRHIANMDNVSQTCCTYIWIPLFILIMLTCAVMLVFGFGTIAIKAPLGAIGFIFALVGFYIVGHYCGCIR